MKQNCTACQRHNLDPGLRVYSQRRVSNSIPTHSDCLMLSSFEDYLSFKTRQSSWLVQALCDVVNKHQEAHDILDMMTLVSHRVEMNASNSGQCQRNAKNRTKKTEIRFTLTKFLKF